MINFRYQLISPSKISKIPFIEDIKDKIIVKPTYFSICAADQRYYQGTRNFNVIQEKLPLALIHEAIGIVVYSNNKNFKKNQKVILLPNSTDSKKENSNYNINSKFMSSTIDGFMQEYVVLAENQLVKYDNKINDHSMVLAELLSVSIHAIKSIKNKIKKNINIGIWGDGNLGYLVYVYLVNNWKNINIYVFGTNKEKLSFFNKATKTFLAEENYDIKIDIAFECVGGINSEKAINDIINTSNPLSTIVLLGVSENEISINTRMILQKGINLIGRSRSDRNDFIDAKNFLSNTKKRKQASRIINKIFSINEISDLDDAFNDDYTHPWKTILKWNL